MCVKIYAMNGEFMAGRLSALEEVYRDLHDRMQANVAFVMKEERMYQIGSHNRLANETSRAQERLILERRKCGQLD